MLRIAAPALGGRAGWMAIGIVLGTFTASSAFAQQQPAAQPAQQASAAQSQYVFSSDAGAILNFVKADKTADFEMIMGKIKEALAKSEKPERKEQAKGWRVFKATEPGPAGASIYVFVMDPIAKGADYSIGTLLVEGFGADGQALYKTYSECYGSPAQNILHLALVADMAK
ncbi:MAG TPA: hypothetical protein VH583_11770 [Vicinamibacterales bacterium]|jgi:hypothetical protein